MDIIIKPITLPDRIEWGQAEVARQVHALVGEYKDIVYTDQKTAKKDKAELNKARKELDDKRKDVKKIYTAPLSVFEDEVKELVEEIDATVTRIDKQVKEFDEIRKAEKRTKIEELFGTIEFPFEVQISQIENPKWMNASYKESEIEADLKDLAYHMREDMETLGKVQHSDLAKEYYKKTLNIRDALQKAEEAAEMTKAAEELAADKEKVQQDDFDAMPKPEPAEPEKESVPEPECRMTFTVVAPVSKLKALKAYLMQEGIKVIE